MNPDTNKPRLDHKGSIADGSLTPSAFAREAERVREMGGQVVSSGPHFLLLDLDNDESIETFQRTWPKMREHFGASIFDRWDSVTPGHEHIVIEINVDLMPQTRIALELSLGSDPMRGLLSLVRLTNGIHEPSRLFKGVKL